MCNIYIDITLLAIMLQVITCACNSVQLKFLLLSSLELNDYAPFGYE